MWRCAKFLGLHDGSVLLYLHNSYYSSFSVFSPRLGFHYFLIIPNLVSLAIPITKNSLQFQTILPVDPRVSYIEIKSKGKIYLIQIYLMVFHCFWNKVMHPYFFKDFTVLPQTIFLIISQQVYYAI